MGYLPVLRNGSRLSATWEYLEEHYGVQIDRTRYHVFYEGFASNIIPDITVIPAQEQEGKTDE